MSNGNAITALSLCITAQTIFLASIWIMFSAQHATDIKTYYMNIMIWNAWWLFFNILLLVMFLCRPFRFIRKRYNRTALIHNRIDLIQTPETRVSKIDVG